MSANLTVKDDKVLWNVDLLDAQGHSVGKVQVAIDKEGAKKAAEDLIKAVYQNSADLNKTISLAVDDIRSAASELMSSMKNSYSRQNVQNFGTLLSTIVDFSKYLQHIYVSINVPTRATSEGSLHIIRHSPPPGSNDEIYAITFSPYLSPGGALRPKVIYGTEALIKFLVDEVGIPLSEAERYVTALNEQSNVSIPQVVLRQNDSQRLGFV